MIASDIEHGGEATVRANEVAKRANEVNEKFKRRKSNTYNDHMASSVSEREELLPYDWLPERTIAL